MIDLLRLLWGTILLRPYVFAFLVVYLIASANHQGWRRTLVYLPVGYGLAWLSEYCSIHWGFPYGDYYYIPHTADRELWVAGVPFMDSLSYVFLSYCSFATALFLMSPVTVVRGELFILETRDLRRSWRTLLLGAFLFVFLDVIIDPVALQGYRWFLGQIYGYREVGLYFGVPMSNFYGWLVVGLVLVGAQQILDRFRVLDAQGRLRLSRFPGLNLLGPVLFLAVLGFNLSVTFWIGEHLLGLVGTLLVGVFLILTFFFTLHKFEHVTASLVQRHLINFPYSRAAVVLLEMPAAVAVPGPMPADPGQGTGALRTAPVPDADRPHGSSAITGKKMPGGQVS
jgi:uncharacterized membrane protein